jgi:hypothetical protein
METGATLRLNPEEYRSVYQHQMKNYLQFIKDQCAKYKIDLAFCDMHLAPQQVLREYLVKRNKMM